MIGEDSASADSSVIPQFFVGKVKKYFEACSPRAWCIKLSFLSWQKNYCDRQLNKNL